MSGMTQDITIPEWELNFTFARSSGPGGQNVNKVNSKAVLRWYPATSSMLPGAARERFLSLFGNRLTADGALVIASDRSRDQGRNRENCIEKLVSLIQEARTPPKIRRKTKPTRGSQRRRIQSKRLSSERKRSRKAVNLDD